MILFLNYLPAIISALAILLTAYFLKKRKYEKAIVSFCCGLGLAFITMIYFTSYGPKGTVAVSQPPPFEEVDAPVENRLRQPAKTDEQRREDYYELTDWKTPVEQAKQEKKQEEK